jgi:hypothetical protein
MVVEDLDWWRPAVRIVGHHNPGFVPIGSNSFGSALDWSLEGAAEIIQALISTLIEIIDFI